jgi:hypothetical protein
MLVRFVLWSLADSDATIADLRTYLREESVDQFSEVPGLLFKAWVSDLEATVSVSDQLAHLGLAFSQ